MVKKRFIQFRQHARMLRERIAEVKFLVEFVPSYQVAEFSVKLGISLEKCGYVFLIEGFDNSSSLFGYRRRIGIIQSWLVNIFNGFLIG